MTKLFYFHRFWLPFYHALWVFCLVYMLYSVSGEIYTHHIDDQRAFITYEVHSCSPDVRRLLTDMMHRRGLPIGFDYPLGSITWDWEVDAATPTKAVYRVKMRRLLSHENRANGDADMDPLLRMIHDMFSCQTPLLGDIPFEQSDGTFHSDFFSYESFKRVMHAHFNAILGEEEQLYVAATHPHPHPHPHPHSHPAEGADASIPYAASEQTPEQPGTKRRRRSRSV